MEDSRVIVAMDFDEKVAALQLFELLGDEPCKFKLGLQLFTKLGPDILRQLQSKRHGIFLDLKYYDISNTVVKACLEAAKHGVWMMNIHAQNGSKTMSELKDVFEDVENKPLITGVTLLTDKDQAYLDEMGIAETPEEYVLRLAKLVYKSGLDGVVASAKEAFLLRKIFGKDFKLVTPAIRFAGENTDDQIRVVTPKKAIIAGSDYLVMGRPITTATDPLSALRRANDEVCDGLHEVSVKGYSNIIS